MFHLAGRLLRVWKPRKGRASGLGVRPCPKIAVKSQCRDPVRRVPPADVAGGDRVETN